VVGVPWTLTVNNSVISNNHAGDAGGGIDADGMGKVFINAGTVITGNTSINQGAGIWLDAVGQGSVTSVTVTSGGTGYATAPTVTFSAPPAGGTTATGTAVITNGVVTAVNITNPGSGYNTPPTITFTGGGTGAAATANLLPVTANLTVTGALISGNTAIAADNVGGGIGNAGNGTVTIIGSTIANNYSGGVGGGFGDENALGTLVVQNSLFLDNSAFGNGGGISAGGPSTTITSTELKGNASGANGGGVFANGVTLTVLDSTFVGNTAAMNGGGVEIETTGTGDQASTISFSTITGNSALNNGVGQIGGGIDVGNGGNFTGTLTLQNDTINANFAFSGGGLAVAHGGVINVQNTIIAGNQVTNAGPDYVTTNGSTITSLGGNLVGVPYTDGAFHQATDQVGTTANPLDPKLGPLQNNGGPTVGDTGAQALVLETEALLTGSPAMGKAVNTGATTDERGFQFATITDEGAVQTVAAPVGTPNQQYVAAVYQLLLHRAPDPGAAAWVNALNQGISRASVVLAIESSTEYRGLVVQSLFQRFLHRAADPAGLQAFVNFLGTGGTVEQVEVILLSSPEYFQLHGGTNNGFVTGLYQDVLGRSPDAAGLAAYTQALNGGLARSSVANLLVTSREAFANLVQTDYFTSLGRQADAAGTAGWVQAFEMGATDQQVLASILGSAEAFAHLTT
jgi:hypothetical protein